MSEKNKPDGQESPVPETQETAPVRPAEEIPPLSQEEQEHLTYLAVYEKYNEYQKKRYSVRRYGTLFILLSGLVFLLLMFTRDSKVNFLILWIAAIIFCVVLMIRADYLYKMYKDMLGISDEYDEQEREAAEEEAAEISGDVGKTAVQEPGQSEKEEKGDVKPT